MCRKNADVDVILKLFVTVYISIISDCSRCCFGQGKCMNNSCQCDHGYSSHTSCRKFEVEKSFVRFYTVMIETRKFPHTRSENKYLHYFLLFSFQKLSHIHPRCDYIYYIRLSASDTNTYYMLPSFLVKSVSFIHNVHVRRPCICELKR